MLREAHSVINILQPTLGADELAAVGDVFASSWVDRERMTSVGSCSEGVFVSMQLAGAGPQTDVVPPTEQEDLDAFACAGSPAWHIAGPLSKRALYVGVRERTDGRER
ncbi:MULTISPECIES: hypothetical protein [Amycolatopsis]|uniref:hypothetical protein n=1 Tax=Amycolatopsis TaxID=1813 RepID=UPI00174E0C59|nr:hypothetical protein [Amycolatopsis bullii]